MYNMDNFKLFSSMMLVLLAGCQMHEEILDNRADESVYSAVIEDFGAGTRTALEGNRVLWSAGDRIIVFEGTDTGVAFELDEDCAGSSAGDFLPGAGDGVSGTGKDIGAVVALYPYDEDVRVSAAQTGTIEVTGVKFPSEQQYRPGSFAEGSFPMASVTAEGDGQLSFRNLGGVLKFSVKGSGNVSRITVTGNGAENLSGIASVYLDIDGMPSVKMGEDAFETVSLVCDPPVQLSENEPVEFYISVPPVDFSIGFEVELEDESGNRTVRKTSKSNQVKRSGILAMPEFSLSTDERCVDLGLSVKWAAWNVGATKPSEYGSYYGWGETQSRTSFLLTDYAYYDSASGSYIDIGTEISGTEYDVAAAEWGDGWRMPTLEEVNELMNDCVWSKVVIDGVGGHKATGADGSSIFIPNAGYWRGRSLYSSDDYFEGPAGYFWIGTLGPGNGKEAYIFSSDNGSISVNYRYWNRYFGIPVRPVKD